jgi:hypothetical protein
MSAPGGSPNLRRLANKNARIAWALLRHDREYALDYTSVLATK